MADLAKRTMDQQRQLWLEIAQCALNRWDIVPRKTRWLGRGSNVVFRVTAAQADYALRLHPPGSTDAARLRAELEWLTSIRRETHLLAPHPVLARVDGREQQYLALHHDLLPPPSTVYAVLFDYIGGESKPASELSADDVYRIGVLLGALHSEAQFKAAGDFEGRLLDWAGLFGEDSPYASPSAGASLRAEQGRILDQAAQQLRAQMSTLASKSGAMGLIHADLLAKNILFRAESIAALDFEYCGWGFYLYDLAPLLWQLKGERAADYLMLEDVMWRGYTSVRRMDEGDRALLETFIAARQIASIRWLLRNLVNPMVSAVAPALIAERCVELEVFLETGTLRRASPTL
ncbi:MAG: phosphotransferase [Chloroflexi bacterium]|nr:phosphotransferase [Chloroflexota bacterium]